MWQADVLSNRSAASLPEPLPLSEFKAEVKQSRVTGLLENHYSERKLFLESMDGTLEERKRV